MKRRAGIFSMAGAVLPPDVLAFPAAFGLWKEIVMRRKISCALVACLLLIVVGSARADSILYVNGTLTKTPAGPNTNWDYQFRVTDDATVRSGDFFVIVDFGGYVAGSIYAAPGWTATTETFTPGVFANNVASPPGLLPAVDTGSTNLRFTYSGGGVLGPDVILGHFGAVTSLLVQYDDGITVARDHNIAGTRTEANSGYAPVPVPLPPAVWAGLSLMGLMGIKGYRRQRLIKAGE
jgi:hypothetical protein